MLFKSWDPPKWWKSKNPYNETISEKNQHGVQRQIQEDLNAVDSL